jgi:hypothetical protein
LVLRKVAREGARVQMSRRTFGKARKREHRVGILQSERAKLAVSESESEKVVERLKVND